MTLDKLPHRTIAIVTGFQAPNDDIETRLREIGFAEGDEVQPLHYGLFGATPITVRLNSALIALRRNEASYITVTDTESGGVS